MAAVGQRCYAHECAQEAQIAGLVRIGSAESVACDIEQRKYRAADSEDLDREHPDVGVVCV